MQHSGRRHRNQDYVVVDFDFGAQFAAGYPISTSVVFTAASAAVFSSVKVTVLAWTLPSTFKTPGKSWVSRLIVMVQ